MEEFMKNRILLCVAFAAIVCAMVVSVNAIVQAQHDHQGHDMQKPPPEAFRASTEKPFSVLMDEAMAIMHKGMDQASKTGDPDHDFATMMIPHHQGAVDMAKVELVYGKDPVLRRLAQEIIVSQEQEIEVMRMRLKQLKAR
jgi:uncharacterized protein (DUF305 family)